MKIEVQNHCSDLYSLYDTSNKLWYKSSVTESNSVNLANTVCISKKCIMPKKIMLDTFMGHNFDYL